MKVLIVGGGVIGLSIAWELATRGAAVQLLERKTIGAGASCAAAGILPAARLDTSVDAIDRLRGHSHELYPAWAAEICRVSGVDIGLRRCGGLYLASTAGEAATLLAGRAHWTDLGIAADAWTPATLGARIPAMSAWANSARFRAAVWVEDDWQVRPPKLVEALGMACRAVGVQIDEHVEGVLERREHRAIYQVRSLRGGSSEGGVRGSASDSELEADAVVLCSGAWAGQVAHDFGLKLSVVPIRGQMLLYQFDRPPFGCVVNEGHRYLVPRDDGTVLVGSCEEEVGFEEGTTPEILAMLTAWASGVFPELAGRQAVQAWSGLRPASFDGFPILGQVPDVENLYVATGHFRSGVHLAPATAERLADLIQGRSPKVESSAFDTGRAVATLSTSRI